MSRERRRLLEIEEEPAEPGRFGCPMLTRMRMARELEGKIPDMRCSLGWALHGEPDAARCRATDLVTDCWKVHPERIPVVVLPVPASSEGIDDRVAEKAAGD